MTESFDMDKIKKKNIKAVKQKVRIAPFVIIFIFLIINCFFIDVCI